MEDGLTSKDFVRSLDRGLGVLRAFSAQTPAMSLSEVARRTGLTRAAARRLVLTLVELGYVRARGREFSLTPRVLDLGYSYLSSVSLPEVAEPHLERLVAEVGESSSVAVLDNDEIVYVARVPTSRIMTVAINVGTRFPAYATSMGRVLLAGLAKSELDTYLRHLELSPLSPLTVSSKSQLRAELEQVQEQGWAIVDQELEEGLRSAAAPIRQVGGEVVAAINVSTQAGRTSLEEIRKTILPQLIATAAQIEVDLHATAGRPVR